MKNRIYLVFISSLLLMFSTQLLAHSTEPGGGVFGGLLHIFTGEHLIMLVLVAVFAVGLTRLYRRFR